MRVIALLLPVLIIFASVTAIESQQTQVDWLNKSVAVSETNVPVYDVIKRLHMDYKVPISFIEAEDKETVTVQYSAGTLRGLLDNLVTAGGGTYRYLVQDSRLVFLPVDAKYDSNVRGIEITNQPRIEAADNFVEQLRGQNTAFRNLIPPFVFGDPKSPVFTEPVSLTASGTTLQYLLELLGTDKKLVFVIIPAKSGSPVLFFKQIK